MSDQRLIIGISGASGAIYGQRMLEVCHSARIESHLVISKAAEMTIHYELDCKAETLADLAHKKYAIQDVGAPIASGSFQGLGMVITPCSVRTFSEIATGVTSSLLTRAADVMLKERRSLVLMVRETPLHLGHLRSLTKLAEMGAIIAPPVPAFYSDPENIDDLVNQSVGRVLDLFGIKAKTTKRWGEDLEKGRR